MVSVLALMAREFSFIVAARLHPIVRRIVSSGKTVENLMESPFVSSRSYSGGISENPHRTRPQQRRQGEPGPVERHPWACAFCPGRRLEGGCQQRQQQRRLLSRALVRQSKYAFWASGA